MNPSILSVSDGQAVAVYDDRWRFLMEALGQPVIQRATNVEHDGEQWVATHIETGHVIACDPDRSKVIAAEVQWLNQKLQKERKL